MASKKKENYVMYYAAGAIVVLALLVLVFTGNSGTTKTTSTPTATAPVPTAGATATPQACTDGNQTDFMCEGVYSGTQTYAVCVNGQWQSASRFNASACEKVQPPLNPYTGNQTGNASNITAQPTTPPAQSTSSCFSGADCYVASDGMCVSRTVNATGVAIAGNQICVCIAHSCVAAANPAATPASNN